MDKLTDNLGEREKSNRPESVLESAVGGMNPEIDRNSKLYIDPMAVKEKNFDEYRKLKKEQDAPLFWMVSDIMFCLQKYGDKVVLDIPTKDLTLAAMTIDAYEILIRRMNIEVKDVKINPNEGKVVITVGEIEIEGLAEMHKESKNYIQEHLAQYVEHGREYILKNMEEVVKTGIRNGYIEERLGAEDIDEKGNLSRNLKVRLLAYEQISTESVLHKITWTLQKGALIGNFIKDVECEKDYDKDVLPIIDGIIKKSLDENGHHPLSFKEIYANQFELSEEEKMALYELPFWVESRLEEYEEHFSKDVESKDYSPRFASESAKVVKAARDVIFNCITKKKVVRLAVLGNYIDKLTSIINNCDYYTGRK